jgi:hypothetical protein
VRCQEVEILGEMPSRIFGEMPRDQAWIKKDFDSRRSWIGGDGLPSRDHAGRADQSQRPLLMIVK